MKEKTYEEEKCPGCNGSGKIKPREEEPTCGFCGGTGKKPIEIKGEYDHLTGIGYEGESPFDQALREGYSRSTAM